MPCLKESPSRCSTPTTTCTRPRDALTKHLPDAYTGAIDYVDVHGRTKIVVRGQISEYIPNPTFDRVGRPGAQEEYFKRGNPEGKSQREMIGRGIDCPPAFRDPSARLELMDEQGVDYAVMYPTLASLVEERMQDDPDLCAAAIHALNQWMTRGVAVRLRGSHLLDADHHPRARRERHRRARVGPRPRRPRRAHAARAGLGLPGTSVVRPARVRPLLGAGAGAGMLVVLHASDTGYVRYTNEWEGTHTESAGVRQATPVHVGGARRATATSRTPSRR